MKHEDEAQVLAPSGTHHGESVAAPPSEVSTLEKKFHGSAPAAMVCPNCGSLLEGRKCKLFCFRPGCGYQVTCAEW